MLQQVEQTNPELDLELIPDVKGYLHRFVDLPSEFYEEVLANWIIHTWAFRAFYVTPYLYISSAGPGTGKTRTMDVIGVLVRNADTATDSPVHVLAQEIEANCPTMLFDEIDTVWAGGANNSKKRILNIGYQKGACVKRQRASVVESWSVFCPKILAGIRNNHLPTSLLSRCIPIEMQPRRRELERFNKFHQMRDPEREVLVDRIASFSDDFLVDVVNQRPEPLKALDDRENEIVEPLLAIAIVLGREQELREALKAMYRRTTAKPSHEQVLLGRIRNAFDQQAAAGGPPDRIFSEDLVKALGSSYTPRLVGILLAELGFVRTAKEMLRIDTQVKRGYCRSDLEPLFLRYLDQDSTLEVVEDEEEAG